MRNLFDLLARTHRWLLFLVLWGIALSWMNTTYSHHRTAFANWSLRASGSWLDAVGNAQNWSHLSESNRLVMLENARLRAELEALKEDGPFSWKTGYAEVLRSPGWSGTPWMVVNAGGREGLRPGAGVLSVGFAAGRVVDTTAHEGLVLSLTHPEAQWSVRIGRHGQAGRLVSVPGDVRHAQVLDIPWAQLVLPGDTVMTTGFDGVFPADVPVGFVEDVLGNEADEFQTVVVKLGADYPGSRHVVWLNNPRNARLDSMFHASSSRP